MADHDADHDACIMVGGEAKESDISHAYCYAEQKEQDICSMLPVGRTRRHQNKKLATASMYKGTNGNHW